MKTISKFPRKVRETPNLFIPLADGTKLAARIWMPADAAKKPVPAILEYLPCRKRDGTHVRDAPCLLRSSKLGVNRRARLQ